ncbi:hypothetical protein BC832DRAFT_592657 [Gaertneriomyces semiglobifer]|nr:hypothetical protein BC832DRAFT_592657 [Gaertneriomyces semiglobifer]
MAAVGIPLDEVPVRGWGRAEVFSDAKRFSESDIPEPFRKKDKIPLGSNTQLDDDGKDTTSSQAAAPPPVKFYETYERWDDVPVHTVLKKLIPEKLPTLAVPEYPESERAAPSVRQREYQHASQSRPAQLRQSSHSRDNAASTSAMHPTSMVRGERPSSPTTHYHTKPVYYEYGFNNSRPSNPRGISEPQTSQSGPRRQPRAPPAKEMNPDPLRPTSYLPRIQKPGRMLEDLSTGPQEIPARTLSDFDQKSFRHDVTLVDTDPVDEPRARKCGCNIL